MMNSSSNPRHARRFGSAFLLVAIGAVLGTALSGGLGLPGSGTSSTGSEELFPSSMFANSLFAQESSEARAMEGEEYTFFTFRRNLWAIHRASGKVQFMVFPDSQDQQPQRSVTHQVDLELFPVDQVEYQLSERNLTNFLWILNPVTGKARYLRAARDAGLEVSDVQEVSRLGR